jgi:hypothetical protein
VTRACCFFGDVGVSRQKLAENASPSFLADPLHDYVRKTQLEFVLSDPEGRELTRRSVPNEALTAALLPDRKRGGLSTSLGHW